MPPTPCALTLSILRTYAAHPFIKIPPTNKLHSSILPPSEKECNYRKHASQICPTLTKFIVSSISIYVLK